MSCLGRQKSGGLDPAIWTWESLEVPREKGDFLAKIHNKSLWESGEVKIQSVHQDAPVLRAEARQPRGVQVQREILKASKNI